MAQHFGAVINSCAIENREGHPRHTCGRDPCTSSQTTNLLTLRTLKGYLEVWIHWCLGISVHIIEEQNFNCQSLRALVMPAAVWVVLGPCTCLFRGQNLVLSSLEFPVDNPQFRRWRIRSGKLAIAPTLLGVWFIKYVVESSRQYSSLDLAKSLTLNFPNHLHVLNTSRDPTE